MSRPSDNMQPAGKRRPGQQLTKDNYDDSEDEGQGVDPGTWGKADAATMAKRKVIKVRRGGAAPDPVDQTPAAAAADAASSNPFAGVSLTAAAPPAAATNPFAGVSMTAAVTGQAAAADAPQDGKQADDAPAAAGGDSSKAAAADAPAAADADNKAPVAAEAKEAASPAAAAAAPADTAGADDKQPSQQDKQEEAAAKADDKAAPAAAAAPSTGFGGFGAAGTTSGFGGFGGFGAAAAGGSGFGGGGFGGFAAAATKDAGAGAGGGLFSGFNPPQPGSLFGSGSFGSGAAKDVEEGGGGGGDGEEGGEDNGQEVFGGPEVAPVVQLSEVPKQTGEEDENSVFTADGKLYEFVDGKDWKERGRGDLRLNVHRSSHRGRLVMRQKGSQRLLLNANLFPKMTTSKMVGGKGATFAAVNAAPPVPGEGGAGAGEAADAAATAAAAPAAAAPSMKTYAFKTKSADDITAFLAAVDKYKTGEAAGDDGQQAAAANPDGW